MGTVVGETPTSGTNLLDKNINLYHTKNMSETITISKKEYDQLIKDSEFLEALRQAGVDNWDGYGYTFEILKEFKDN